MLQQNSVVFTIVLGLSLAVSAQEPATFHGAVDRCEENIAKLLSYTAKIRVFEKSTQRLTVGDDVLDILSLAEFEVLSDVTRDSMLIVKNRIVVDASYFSTLPLSSVYLRSKGKSYRSMGQQLKAFDDANVPYEGFFDPRVIGIGFCFELRSIVRVQDVLANIKAWREELAPTESGDDVLLFSRGTISRMAFDKRSGYAISEILNSGVKAKTSHIEKAGVFLPSVARYQCSKGSNLIIECEWISVNEPIPPERFEADRVANLLGLELVE